MKLTPWFPAEVKPVRPGLYQTDATGGESYQIWTGKYWGLQGTKYSFWPFIPKNAEDHSIYQNVKWRGLAEPPKKAKAK